MAIKAPRWCAKCRVSHAGECPQRVVWQKKPAVVSGRGGRPWRRKRERIFNRDNFLCQIHFLRGELRSVSLSGVDAGICDHKVPLSQGGTDDDENLQTICAECDKEKTSGEALRGRGGKKGF